MHNERIVYIPNKYYFISVVETLIFIIKKLYKRANGALHVTENI